MSAAAPTHENREIPAFPAWLDLPEGYLVNDWVRWEKGKSVAKRLRESPKDIALGIDWLQKLGDRLSAHDEEWLNILSTWSVDSIIELLESDDHEGQRLRSGMPFKGEPFITKSEMEGIRERAYAG